MGHFLWPIMASVRVLLLGKCAFLVQFTVFDWFSRFLQEEWKKKILGALLDLNEHMDAL